MTAADCEHLPEHRTHITSELDRCEACGTDIEVGPDGERAVA